MLPVHLVEKIRQVWVIRNIKLSALMKQSGLSRNFLWDLKKRTFDLSDSTQKALAHALRVPLRYLVDDELWDSKPAEFIIALSALEEYFKRDNIPTREQNVFRKVLDGGVLYLEPDEWRKLSRALKIVQNQRQAVTDLTQSINETRLYRRPIKPAAPERRKP